MKLSELLPIVASTLGLPPASVRVLGAHLRKHGLITRGGRGRGGAEMTPTDLTNLLLAAMSGGQAKDAHLAVIRLREASVDPRSERQDEPARPIEDHPMFMRPHQLGEALDAIFLSYAAEDEFNDEGYGFPITNMFLTVHSPHTLCYEADLWLDNGSEDWTLRYHRNHPDFDDLPRDQWQETARGLVAGKGDLAFTARVTSNTFYELAEALGQSAGEEANRRLAAVLDRRSA
ncbi:hypothetical protein [Brevundimonas sp. A19_0]|uniref:hypothetical protein n=1 Tax=Brevundimonas sp. A19_0 TaxID=2821087 RepID=UPI001ADB5591|nr:hypothetical protein [Brevundimonas sp. A19_0]MBO9501631.1 hypothetical protein [Brevundimonas sp. A19_0]